MNRGSSQLFLIPLMIIALVLVPLITEWMIDGVEILMDTIQKLLRAAASNPRTTAVAVAAIITAVYNPTNIKTETIEAIIVGIGFLLSADAGGRDA